MKQTTINHTTNRINDQVARKDTLFDALTYCYLLDKEKFREIRRSVQGLLKKIDTEEMCALAGYVFYLEENFKKATLLFYKSVSLNPDNMDNWMDLAFSLRHQGEKKLSYAILFYFDDVIRYYKQFRLGTNDLGRLKKMLELIYSHVD